jgi:dTDP-4-dehydrorhamnose 3,5-epimerase
MRPIQIVTLSPLRDRRGSLTEIFRQEWVNSVVPVQWNYVQSEANVLRGVHVHVNHIDYLVVGGYLLRAT